MDQKSGLRHHKDQSSPPPHPSPSERSIAFKRWARSDHQVSSCKDSFRCIRCRRPRHRERHCRLRSTSSTLWVNSSLVQPPQQMKSWADVVAMPSPSECCPTRPTSTVAQSPSLGLHNPSSAPSRGKDVHDCHVHASQAPTTFDLQSSLAPLLE